MLFAYWVVTGVTDLDLGVMGILNYSPTNAVAYWVMDGITDLVGCVGDPER